MLQWIATVSPVDLARYSSLTAGWTGGMYSTVHLPPVHLAVPTFRRMNWRQDDIFVKKKFRHIFLINREKNNIKIKKNSNWACYHRDPSAGRPGFCASQNSLGRFRLVCHFSWQPWIGFDRLTTTTIVWPREMQAKAARQYHRVYRSPPRLPSEPTEKDGCHLDLPAIPLSARPLSRIR